MTPVLHTAAAEPAVSLIEAKLHLRIDHTDEDLEVLEKTAAAQEHVESFTGPLVDSTWELYLDDWPDVLKLPAYKLQEIVSIKYTDSDGVEATLPSADYVEDLVTPGGRVLPVDDWPSVELRLVNGVKVTYRAGWDSASVVPRNLRAAVLLRLGTLWEQRQSVLVGAQASVESKPLSDGEAACINPYRLW